MDKAREQDLAFATKGLDVALAEISAVRADLSRMAADVTAAAAENPALISQALQQEDLLSQRLDGVLTLIAAAQAGIAEDPSAVEADGRVDALMGALLLETQRRDVAVAFDRDAPSAEDDSDPGDIDLF